MTTQDLDTGSPGRVAATATAQEIVTDAHASEQDLYGGQWGDSGSTLSAESTRPRAAAGPLGDYSAGGDCIARWIDEGGAAHAVDA